MNEWDLAIVGAGASGMMAAITAARHGRRALLLEKKEHCGKKLAATGNGKCNFTNEDMELTHFHGDTALAGELLRQFSKADTLDFFREIGVFAKCRNGYYYPNSEQASSVVTLLMAELKRLGVTIRTSSALLDAEPAGDGFSCRLENERFFCKKLLFATGLLASPKLGSDGSAFDLIKRLGHRFSPVVPALCGCVCQGADFAKMAGVRTDAKVSVYVDGALAASDRGELQLAEYGLSGIPVFQISRHAAIGLYEKKQVSICVDFFPELAEEAVFGALRGCAERFPGQPLSDALCGFCSRRIIDALVKKNEPLSDETLHRLSRQLKELTVSVERMRGFEFAQVCAGGIRSEEIQNATLESKLIPGLYFCGELLNVDGQCGGYNLQLAWSSGYVAGLSAAKACERS